MNVGWFLIVLVSRGLMFALSTKTARNNSLLTLFDFGFFSGGGAPPWQIKNKVAHLSP